MGSVNEILELAKSQVGYDRFKDPEQGTKYGRWYADYTGEPWYGLNGVPYCAMYISWLLDKTHTLCAWFPNAVAFDENDKAILGDAYVDKNSLKVGDIVGFDWNKDKYGDHVGLVLEVHTNYIVTNEGNTDNGKVKERTRAYSDITCGVRPFYSVDSLVVSGIWDRATTYALQKDFGTQKDGVVSGQSSWTCNNPGISAGKSFQLGVGGSKLIKAMQKWLGVEDDGYFGPVTMKFLMNRLGIKIEYPIEISNPSLTVAEMQRRLIRNGTIK